jgi:hypothetical protein
MGQTIFPVASSEFKRPNMPDQDACISSPMLIVP